MTTLGLYIHIPWCRSRCIYCDFNSYVSHDHDLKARYQAALLKEIRQAGIVLARPNLDTIYIGGGTPTSLPATQLVELINIVKTAFAVRAEAEITVEANPGTVSADYLRELRQGGFNRLSLGVQSFNEAELRFLSRLHDADMARQAIAQARAVGFDNLSLDLIFNLPHQTLSQWQTTLHEAIRLAPDHLSIYSLIVETDTPLHRRVTQAEITPPDDDLAADMYAYTIEALSEAGYAHYEISNWARHNGEADGQTPRLASAHNLIYWRNQPYLGVGAGACSTINGQRWTNLKQPQHYVERLDSSTSQLAIAHDGENDERIDPTNAMMEQMLLGLRLVREGVAAAEFARRFNITLEEQFAQAIAFGLQHGLTEWLETANGQHLRLTQRGRFLANQAMIPFMAEIATPSINL